MSLHAPDLGLLLVGVWLGGFGVYELMGTSRSDLQWFHGKRGQGGKQLTHKEQLSMSLTTLGIAVFCVAWAFLA